MLVVMSSTFGINLAVTISVLSAAEYTLREWLVKNSARRKEKGVVHVVSRMADGKDSIMVGEWLWVIPKMAM